MKNSRFELEVQFKDKKYLQLQKIQLDPGIESIIEEGKYKNWEKSKLKKNIKIYLENKLQIKNEEIRKVALKIEKKDIKIFSSEIKYILEKEENIKLKDELILNKENITKISMNYNYTKNNNIYQIIILFLFISSFKLEKRREETYSSGGNASLKSIQR